jgi:hypothetical protein
MEAIGRCPSIREFPVNYYIISLDLGQAAEHSALAIVEPRSPDRGRAGNYYDLRHLERFSISTRYPEIRDYVGGLIRQLPLPCEVYLLVGITGVGIELYRYFADAKAKQVVGLMLDNGTGEAARDKQLYRVPKRGVVSATQLALQTDRLKIARGLGLAAEFTKELVEFRPRLPTVTDASAWRDKVSDDLVLATAGAVWFAGQQTWDEDPEEYEEDDGYGAGRSPIGGY